MHLKWHYEFLVKWLILANNFYVNCIAICMQRYVYYAGIQESLLVANTVATVNSHAPFVNTSCPL